MLLRLSIDTIETTNHFWSEKGEYLFEYLDIPNGRSSCQFTFIKFCHLNVIAVQLLPKQVYIAIQKKIFVNSLEIATEANEKYSVVCPRNLYKSKYLRRVILSFFLSEWRCPGVIVVASLSPIAAFVSLKKCFVLNWLPQLVAFGVLWSSGQIRGRRGEGLKCWN